MAADSPRLWKRVSGLCLLLPSVCLCLSPSSHRDASYRDQCGLILSDDTCKDPISK